MKLFELTKQADAISRNYQQGNLSQESLDRLRASGALRPEKRYIDGTAKATKNILHDVAWDSYVKKNQPELQKIVDSNPNLNHINDLRNDPVHRIASYKLAPKIKRGVMDIKYTSELPENASKQSILSRKELAESNKARKSHINGFIARQGGGYASVMPRMPMSYRGDLYAADIKHKSSLNSSMMHNPNSNTNQVKMNDRLGLYHEALELKHGTKTQWQNLENMQEALNSSTPKKYHYQVFDAHMARELNPKEIEPYSRLYGRTSVLPYEGKYYATVGMHMSPKVLTGEANQISHIPYPNMTSHLRNLRYGTGEKALFEKHLGKDIYTTGTKPGDYRKLMSSLNRSGDRISVAQEADNFVQHSSSLIVPNQNGMNNIAYDIPNLPKTNPQPQALNTVRPQQATPKPQQAIPRPQPQVAAASRLPQKKPGTLRSLLNKTKSLFRR